MALGGAAKELLAAAENVDGGLAARRQGVGGADDDGAAAVGDQRAVEQPQGRGDDARIAHVVDGDRVTHMGQRMLRRIGALGRRDVLTRLIHLGAAQLLAIGAEVVLQEPMHHEVRIVQGKGLLWLS